LPDLDFNPGNSLWGIRIASARHESGNQPVCDETNSYLYGIVYLGSLSWLEILYLISYQFMCVLFPGDFHLSLSSIFTVWESGPVLYWVRTGPEKINRIILCISIN